MGGLFTGGKDKQLIFGEVTELQWGEFPEYS